MTQHANSTGFSLSAGEDASVAGRSWRRAGPAQRFASLVGGALILVGLAHLAAWLVIGGAWQGPVSFRKPTTFGISFGLTTVTLAWITGHLQLTERTRWLLLGPLAVADSYEVAWVATQRWRGVASHFNFATTLDYALFLLGRPRSPSPSPSSWPWRCCRTRACGPRPPWRWRSAPGC